MQSKQYPYLDRLDHLRFYAAALVVVFHFFHAHVGDLRSGNPLVSLIDEGHTGIALFMVISGFILTLIAGEQDIHYAGFVKNRVLRIYPLFVFAVMLQLLISTYNEHRNYGFLQLLSWLMPFRSETVPLSPYFVQLWTIWVEFQFYLIFPFLLAFTRRYGSRYLWSWLLLLAVVRAMVWLTTGSVRYLAYETLFGRLDQFIVGMLAARLWLVRLPRSGQERPAPWWLLLPAGLVLLLIHLFSRRVGFTDIDSGWWVFWPLLEALAWASLVWTYLRVRAPRIAASCWSGAGTLLSLLGMISFSLYVLHNLVIHLVNRQFMPHLLAWLPSPWSIAAGVLLTFALLLPLALLTWRLVEQPFLSFRVAYIRART